MTFDNFRQSYTGNVSSCGSNFVFRPHSGAFDQVGSAFVYTSTCNNCDTNSFLTTPDPNPAFLGWFGGCGDIVCTGFINYVVQDFTGTFFGFKGTIIPKNEPIGANEQNCTFSATMNAYMCTEREDFGVLEYQSVAPDFQTRIMWPVYLTYDGSDYTTATNGWRDW